MWNLWTWLLMMAVLLLVQNPALKKGEEGNSRKGRGGGVLRFIQVFGVHADDINRLFMQLKEFPFIAMSAFEQHTTLNWPLIMNPCFSFSYEVLALFFFLMILAEIVELIAHKSMLLLSDLLNYPNLWRLELVKSLCYLSKQLWRRSQKLAAQFQLSQNNNNKS